MAKIKVVVVQVELSEDFEKLKAVTSNEPVLLEITDYVENWFAREGIETFQKFNNLLVTEKGYQFVCRVEDE